MKKSSIIAFRENYRLSELSQIIMYLQQLAASGTNVARFLLGIICKMAELEKN
jgi:hypothetical protein